MTTLRYRGPFWMPITPETGSLFHAETHADIISGIAVASIIVGIAGQAVLLWIAWHGLSWTPAADIATIQSGIAAPKAIGLTATPSLPAKR